MSEEIEYMLDLVQRPRRLRKSDAIRSMVQENWLRTEDFVQPLFVVDGKGSGKGVEGLPGLKRFTIE